MNKTAIRILSAIVLTVVLMSTFSFLLPATAASPDGLTFKSSTVYAGVKPYPRSANTFEATVKFSKNTTGRGGVILGNFENKPCASFEVYEGGAPRLYIMDSSGNYISLVFSNVSLYTGEWVHVAITRDTTARKAHCYINGVLKQTLDCTYPVAMGGNAPLVLGGDYRSGNAQYFKGNIRDVAVFSSTRTAAEIASDYANGASGSTLLARYDLTALTRNDFVSDLSGNGFHFALPTYDGDERLPTIPESMGGMIFAANSNYQLTEAFKSSPEVFEAEVYFPETLPASQRGGVILGNYGRLNDSVSFEVYSGGVPRLYVSDSNAKVVLDVKFDKVNLYTGVWTHVAIVRDTAQRKAHCYINGVLKQSIAIDYTAPIKVSSPLLLGGDYRASNTVYLRGAVRSLAVYGASRDAAKISADYQTVYQRNIAALADGTELALFDLLKRNPENTINDMGKAKNNLRKNLVWFDKKEPVTDYSYTFAVVGDTQIVCEKNPADFAKIYDYILAQQKEKNIQFVFGLGDITNNDTTGEWQTATNGIFRLDGKIPYSLVRGNHDSLSKYNQYISASHYANSGIVCYESSMANTYQTLKVGNIDYLMLTLDFGASNKVLSWASEVIESHPYHNVIISTHAYLYRDGTTLDQNDVCPPATNGGSNNGDHMWEKLMKKHENIVMVLSGHDPCDRVVMTQTPGVAGNVVTQLLIDPQGVDAAQGSTGLVALLHFSEDGKQVQVEYYSTIKEQYFLTENQFSFELNVITAPEEDPNPNPGPDPDQTPDVEPDRTPDVEPDTEQTPSEPSENGGDSQTQASPSASTLTIVAIVAAGVLAAVIVLIICLKKRKK